MKRVWKLFGIVILLLIVMTGVATATTDLLRITSQPTNKSVTAGSTATFSVTATTPATSIHYQWQYRKDANSAWAPSAQSGNKTDMLSVAATNGLHGYQFRCVVSDSYGTVVNSNVATLYISPRITTQPVSRTAAPGTTAKFTVAAAGTGTITYQWQYRKDVNSSWAASAQSGNKTATLSVTATNGLHGYQFRCVITDGSKRKAYTNAVTLSVSPRITAQPVSRTAAPGTTAKFTVAAAGTGTLTYQWQYRKDANSSWASSAQSGNKTATLSVAATNGLHGYQFRCVITDGSKRKAYTNAATLSVSPRITTQPVDKTVTPGATATFTVKAAGTGTLTYQWQYMSPSMTTWAGSAQSGNKTATLSVKSSASLQGYMFRCVITDGSGRKNYTKAVTLTLCDIPINATYFPDAVFRQYVTDNFDTTKDGKLSKIELLAVSKIKVNRKAISNLRGVEFFTVLKELNCSTNNLTALDVSRNTKLERLDCGCNAITSLVVVRNTALKSLICYGNQLGSLDVSRNTALQELNCFECGLTALDLSRNTALEYLECGCNSLPALDVSKNTALQSLYCFMDGLYKLDTSNNTALVEINCSRNYLSELDLSKNTNLKYLKCIYSYLHALDVSKNTALEHLDCGSNYLTVLNLSKNTALEYLDCDCNDLTALNVSKNTKLVSLICYGNKLTVLDLSKNMALKELMCYSNNLTSLDVSKNEALAVLNFWGFNDNDVISLNLNKNTELDDYGSIIPKITKQPVSKTVVAGAKAVFTVAATGVGTLTYQWEYRYNESTAWFEFWQSGNKTDTLNVTALSDFHGYQFRCAVTQGNGQTAYSNVVTLSVSPRIKAHPADTCVALGTTATFAVSAAGTETLAYQWQYMSPTMTSWANSSQNGNKTATLSVKATAGLQGYRFRCVLTDGNGRKVYTDPAMLTIYDAPAENPVAHVHNWQSGSWVEHRLHQAEYVEYCGLCECGFVFYDPVNGHWNGCLIDEHMSANGCISFENWSGRYKIKDEWYEDIQHTYTWCPDCHTVKRSGCHSSYGNENFLNDLPDDILNTWLEHGRKWVE